MSLEPDFLDLNGRSVAVPERWLYQGLLDIAERKLDKAGLAAFLADLAV